MIDTVAGWIGIEAEWVAPLMVLALVVALIVIGFATFAVVMIMRPGPAPRPERSSRDNRTRLGRRPEPTAHEQEHAAPEQAAREQAGRE